jgi:hypothetical protein
VKRIITIASAVLIAAGASAVGLAASAAASTAPRSASGTEHFELVATSVGQSVTFHAIYYGVVTAAGTEFSPSSGNTDTVHLPGGTFKLVHTSPPAPKVNLKECLATATGTAKYKITGGTGRYRGISGKGTAVISEIGILGRVKGACSENAQPAAFFIIVKGSGPLHG